jgi:hypothetical protein
MMCGKTLSIYAKKFQKVREQQLEELLEVLHTLPYNLPPIDF